MAQKLIFTKIVKMVFFSSFIQTNHLGKWFLTPVVSGNDEGKLNFLTANKLNSASTISPLIPKSFETITLLSNLFLFVYYSFVVNTTSH